MDWQLQLLAHPLRDSINHDLGGFSLLSYSVDDIETNPTSIMALLLLQLLSSAGRLSHLLQP